MYVYIYIYIYTVYIYVELVGLELSTYMYTVSYQLCSLFRNCRDDQALYSAFNLSNVLSTGSISSQIEALVNLSQVCSSPLLMK